MAKEKTPMNEVTYIILAVAAISLASFLPRAIPFLLPKGRIKSRFLNSFLNYIPYSVLGAMIFPAIFFATSSVIASAAGAVVAIALSLWEKRLIIVALGSILVTALVLMVI